MERNKKMFFVMLIILPSIFASAQKKDVHKYDYISSGLAKNIDSIVETARNELHLPGVSMVIMHSACGLAYWCSCWIHFSAIISSQTGYCCCYANQQPACDITISRKECYKRTFAFADTSN